MAYLSDIDLATLHKKRLDEKNHYKLSWYNRRFYDDEMSHEQQSVKSEEHKVKSKVGTSAKSSTTKAKVNVEQVNARTSRHSRAANDVNAVSSHHRSNGHRSPDFYDEGYFSSPTLNRRRSGTWP